MNPSQPRFKEIAAEWRAARRVYTVYAAIQKSFDMGLEPCKVLESPIDRSDEQSLNLLRDWLQQMDDRCTAAHVRQVIQNSSVGTGPVLRSLIQRYLNKPQKTDEDRHKVDFLLVQYFAQTAPRMVIFGDIDLEDVAQVLEPVIGESPLTPPRGLEPLKALIERIKTCTTLRDLIRQNIVESGRNLKEQTGPMYFGSSVLVAFTRYNFLLRRAFVQLLHSDIESIRHNLGELEAHDIHVVDCAAAGFGSQEPIADLRRYCRSWRSVFVADYAAGPSFRTIAEVRQIVEHAAHIARTQRKESAAAPAASKPISKPALAAAAEVPVPAAAASRTISAEVAEIEIARARVAAVIENDEKPSSSLVAELKQTIEAISNQVASASDHPATNTSVQLNSLAIVLSSWEKLAFKQSADPVALALQNAVALRAIVSELTHQHRNGIASELHPAIEMAHVHAAELQERIARARDARDLDAAVNLAATSKRLTIAIEEAEACLSVLK